MISLSHARNTISYSPAARTSSHATWLDPISKEVNSFHSGFADNAKPFGSRIARPIGARVANLANFVSLLWPQVSIQNDLKRYLYFMM